MCWPTTLVAASGWPGCLALACVHRGTCNAEHGCRTSDDTSIPHRLPVSDEGRMSWVCRLAGSVSGVMGRGRVGS